MGLLWSVERWRDEDYYVREPVVETERVSWRESDGEGV